MSIFIRQTMAEYKAMGLSPGDENFLRGFEANILRVASDFFLGGLYIGVSYGDWTFDRSRGMAIAD